MHESAVGMLSARLYGIWWESIPALGAQKIREKFRVLRREFGASMDMEKQKGERYMQDIIIALLALYAVWSARKIMRMSAVLHICVRMLGEMLEEEPQDLTNSADRLY